MRVRQHADHDTGTLIARQPRACADLSGAGVGGINARSDDNNEGESCRRPTRKKPSPRSALYARPRVVERRPSATLPKRRSEAAGPNDAGRPQRVLEFNAASATRNQHGDHPLRTTRLSSARRGLAGDGGNDRGRALTGGSGRQSACDERRTELEKKPIFQLRSISADARGRAITYEVWFVTVLAERGRHRRGSPTAGYTTRDRSRSPGDHPATKPTRGRADTPDGQHSPSAPDARRTATAGVIRTGGAADAESRSRNTVECGGNALRESSDGLTPQKVRGQGQAAREAPAPGGFEHQVRFCERSAAARCRLGNPLGGAGIRWAPTR